MTIVFGERRRSVAFVQDGDERWACFLVTFAEGDGRWHGYFSFRPGRGEESGPEVRTANIFLEASEAEIHEKARGLGRPLLTGLLHSARHASGADRPEADPLRGQFRSFLAENAREVSRNWTDGNGTPQDAEGLESLYQSYRLDQVAHLISLVDSDAFEDLVDRILDGERVDFRTKDRLQFAMMVVEDIERRLPLPPFEVWKQDFLEHREIYRVYAHTLHREGRLP